MDWQKIYKQLHAAGMTDKEVAALAGCARETINLVRNGNYPFTHSPAFENARQLKKLHKATIKALGWDTIDEPEAVK